MAHHYGQSDPYEREPLDPSYDQPYDSPANHGQPDHPIYPQESPYHDESPRRRADSHSSSRHHDAHYGSPTRNNRQPPPPPRHGNYGYYSRSGSPPPPPQTDTSYHGHTGPSNITPGADNFSDAASGGMSGIAYSVADRNARESGAEAYRSAGQLPPPPSHAQYPQVYAPRQAYSPRNSGLYAGSYNGHSQDALDRDSRSSRNPFGTVASSSIGSRSPSRSPHVSIPDAYAVEDPYQGYNSTSRHGPTALGMVDPDDIEDDGDDGLDYSRRRGHRNSGMSGRQSDRGRRKRPAIGAAAAVGAGAAAGGAAAGALRKGYRGDYDPPNHEKSSAWLEKRQKRSKRMKVGIILLVLLIIAGAIVGGVVGSFVNNNKGNDSSKSTAAEDDKTDLGKDSAEIKKLLNNPDLHKVFPGMDYTPINVQYPDCMHDPPSQNNVTRDVAVLSQLTNKIRLYGTDCNQTQMVLHAIDRLDLKKDVKVWLGVWQDGNDTTNARQLSQMWDILDEYGGDQFEGLIVANEILFRKEMTISSLGTLLSDVRKNLTKLNIDLPVATSDLGSDWSQSLADESDYIMSNIHPFFGGTPADEAAGWVWDFWKNNNGAFWKSDKSKNIIAEIGWPSGGGEICPPASPNCAEPVKASIDGMNRLMEDWVCQAMENGTNYFWFEAFDEPWKVKFNKGDENWEDKWGLMDVNRNLKKGIKIPDCGGKTI